MKVRIILLAILISSCSSNSLKRDQEHQQLATLWVQTSGEYLALCEQAYNYATWRLKEMANRKTRKPKAIIMDIDETILDNSPFQGKLIKEGLSYTTENFGEWIDRSLAKAVPGSVDFIRNAQGLGVKVFLISNRRIRHLNATKKNLDNIGISLSKEDLFLKTTSESKAQRREHIFDKYEVILQVGDKLSDFNEDFENKSTNDRNVLVKRHYSRFGREYIVLPNPMYGDWLKALYNYDMELSESEQASIREKNLYYAD